MAIDASLLNNISPKKRSPGIVAKKRVPRPKKMRINPWDNINEPEIESASTEVLPLNTVKPDNTILNEKIKKQEIKRIKLKITPSKKKEKYSMKVSDAIKRPTKNFTQIPNAFLEFLYTSNITQNECKFLLLIIKETLGWGRDYCLLSKKDILDKSSITNNLIYKVRESLSSNGIIAYGKSEESTKNFYMVKASFFDIISEDEIKEEFILSDKIGSVDLLEFLKSKNKTKKSLKGELSSVLELVETGKSEEEILILLKNLESHGALDGSVCSRFSAYLSSGAYEAVLARSSGKSTKLFDGQKIFDILGSIDTSVKMSDDIKNNLTKPEIDWIEKKGGLRFLGQMNSDSLRFELKI